MAPKFHQMKPTLRAQFDAVRAPPGTIWAPSGTIGAPFVAFAFIWMHLGVKPINYDHSSILYYLSGNLQHFD